MILPSLVCVMTMDDDGDVKQSRHKLRDINAEKPKRRRKKKYDAESDSDS